MASAGSSEERTISFGLGLPAVPERLLLAHARGEVLFICGAGISRPANLPDFRDLTLGVYQKLDPPVHSIIGAIPRGTCNLWGIDHSTLTSGQAAEAKRFVIGDYDVVLGMLERRLDRHAYGHSPVRREVASILRAHGTAPAGIHRSLMRLADRGGASTIVTTNFDLLLEAAAGRSQRPVQTYALGAIPRPTRQPNFSGVLHIHGALARSGSQFSELVLSDRDFGEFYLRRRVVPDFIYDAARLFHLVLVGYSANDPPMRYLLNAVAADGSRFTDLKERFTFIGSGTADPVALEDWKARGITPIHYDSAAAHSALAQTLERWADLSAINGATSKIHAEVKRIVAAPRVAATDIDRDMFDHFIRRGSSSERARLSRIASIAGADHSWLDAIASISEERWREYRV